MYERFTDRARNVMQLANQEAQRFNHDSVGTGHVLIALIKEHSGIGGSVLENLNVTLRNTRDEMEKLTPSADCVIMGKLPQSPGFTALIEFARDEAAKLDHNYIGTEHLLLAITRNPNSKAAKILENIGVSSETVREEVLRILGFCDMKSIPPDSSVTVKTETCDVSREFSLTFSLLVAVQQGKWVRVVDGKLEMKDE